MAPSAPSAEVITYPTNYSSRATLKYEKLATYPAAPGFADGGLYLATAYLFSDSDSAECNVWAQQQQQQQGGYAIFQSPGTPCAVCSVINFTLCHDLNPYPADSWSGSGMTQNFVNTPYSHVGPPIGPSTNLSVIAHCGVNTCTNKYATYADAVQSLSCGGVLVTNENKTLYISHDQHPGITAVKFCGNCPWAGGWFSGPVSNQHSSGNQLTANLNLPAPGSYAVSISKGGKTLTLNVKGIKLEFANNDPLNLPWTQGGYHNMNTELAGNIYSPDGLIWSGGASNNGVLYFGSNGASYNVHVVASNLPSCYGDKTVNVLKVDLGIDVDDDGDVDDTDEQKEESPGAIIFENWDNDDNDANFQPDKEESSVTGENDLVPIQLKVEPTLNIGTVKLEATAGGNRVKVWTSATKGTEITLPKTWDLATETVPATLYLEGYNESASANDVELKLSYSNGGSSICDDKLKITVVRQNLGVAIYRDLDLIFFTTYEHAGLVTSYIGGRTKSSLTNDQNWVTAEMCTAGIHTNDLYTFKVTKPPFHGYYSIQNLTDVQRNEIIRNAHDCLIAGIAYVWVDAINWSGSTWDGTIANIIALRCDGLVEVCYELAGLEVWGRNGTHYPIQNWPDEHNDLGKDDPQTELSPVVQRGGVANSPTRFIETILFEPQNVP